MGSGQRRAPRDRRFFHCLAKLPNQKGIAYQETAFARESFQLNRELMRISSALLMLAAWFPLAAGSKSGSDDKATIRQGGRYMRG